MAAFLLNFMSARETSGSHGIGVARAVAGLEGCVKGRGGVQGGGAPRLFLAKYHLLLQNSCLFCAAENFATARPSTL